MKPRRTHHSNQVFRLAGGTEDNDLWVEIAREERLAPDDPCEGSLVVRSVWVPTDEERAAIAAGANIELSIYGGQPPVSMATTTVELGRPPQPDVDARDRGLDG